MFVLRQTLSAQEERNDHSDHNLFSTALLYLRHGEEVIGLRSDPPTVCGQQVGLKSQD